MPTDPLGSILDRELSKASAREVIDVASPLLRELVNHATNALARCATDPSRSGEENVDAAPFAIYRQIIELTDGVEVLLSQSCAPASVPLLRSSFEALLSIEHILSDQAGYKRRSLAWTAGYAHKRIEAYERLDPSTGRGRDFKRLLDSDIIAARFQIPTTIPAAAQKAAARLRGLLSKTEFQEIEAERGAIERLRRKYEWYSLFGGPTDLRSLASALRRGGQYEILYRQWSAWVHAQDLLPLIDRTANGKPAIGRLRDPRKIGELACLGADFLLSATRLMLGRFRPGEDIRPWYMREVAARYRMLQTGASPKEEF